MESVELGVYIFVALIVGGLLVAVLRSVDHDENYRNWRDAMKKEEAGQYKIESGRFAQELAMRWEGCRFGIDNKTVSVYVTDEGLLNRSRVLTELKRLDKCDAIDCYNRSNQFRMPSTISIPKIINIQCFNSSLIVT